MAQNEPTCAIGSGAMARPGAAAAGSDWLWAMLGRKPVKVVAVALAKRMARIVSALVRTGESYRHAQA